MIVAAKLFRGCRPANTIRGYKRYGQYWASSSVGWAVGANCFLM